MTSAFEKEVIRASWPRSLGELAATGVTPEMTRSRAWRRTSRGFFVRSDVPSTTTQRILETAPLVPARGAIGGWAAAYALGVDLLDGKHPYTMAPLPISIHLGQNLGRATPDGTRLVRERLPRGDVQLVRGLPVTSPLRTAFDGARWAPDVVEAVVFLDQIGHALELDLGVLELWARPGPRWNGVTRLRDALLLADPASASPWESRLRVFYRLRAKLPRPLVNRPVFDLDGNLLGIPDLLDPEAGLATEFDGEGHREREQHRDDNIREEKLEVVNLTVCRVDSLDFRQPRRLRERLRDRHAQGLRRDRSQDRWTLVEPEWWQRWKRAA